MNKEIGSIDYRYGCEVMTLSEEVGRVINTVDMLGVALATEMHIWTDEERSAYDYVSHNLPRRVQELEAERSDWRNIAEAALFQYDVLMKHAKELEEENRQWQACHEAELGVCQTECDVVAALEAEVSELLPMADVAGWWQGEFQMANVDRNELRAENERLRGELKHQGSVLSRMVDLWESSSPPTTRPDWLRSSLAAPDEEVEE